MSRDVYLLAGVIGGSALAGTIGWKVWDWIDGRHADPAPVAAATAVPLADLTKRAQTNDATAEHELARAHATGEGVPKDEKEAWKWLERSARHGNIEAQYELAIVLREGRGTIQDYDGARHWMAKAAEAGNPQAQFDLGVMYRNGVGIEPDNILAYVWLNLAAAHGVPGAAPLRDAARSQLSSTEVIEAQAEARRLSELYAQRPATAP